MTDTQLTIGLIVNPLAGLGGSVALKGSDNVAEQALALGAQPMANKRAAITLNQLGEFADKVRVLTVNDEMGQSLCQQLGLNYQLVYQCPSSNTTSQDTRNAAQKMIEQQVDVLLFAGGDGTARDICAVVSESDAEDTPVLGIPAGCKIHSGVYAVTPKAAGEVLSQLAQGQMLSVLEANVMDIDEEAFRQGTVKAKLYGDMTVLGELRYIQATKSGGKESNELVLQDIAEYVINEMDDEIHYVMGSGSTVAFIMEEMGLDNTLLGVDMVHDHQLIDSDMTAAKVLEYAKKVGKQHIRLVITVIGGQGHILGRGNQQLSPDLIRFVGKENLMVVATKTKLNALAGRPLLVDTGDEALDKELAGVIKVVTGYNDYVMYPVGFE